MGIWENPWQAGRIDVVEPAGSGTRRGVESADKARLATRLAPAAKAMVRSGLESRSRTRLPLALLWPDAAAFLAG